MTVVRYEPWGLLNRLRRELDENFEGAARDATWSPAVDIHEEPTQFTVRADQIVAEQIDLLADRATRDIQPADCATQASQSRVDLCMNRLSLDRAIDAATQIICGEGLR